MRRSNRLSALLAGAALALGGLGAQAVAAEFSHHVVAASWRHQGTHLRWHRAGWHPVWRHGGNAGWHPHPGQARHGKGHHRNHHHDGLVHLPTLPILIEAAAPEGFGYGHTVYRAPGVPDAVPYVHAGPRFAARGASYAPAFYGGIDWLPGSGAYAGDIEAVTAPGNGTFIAFYGGAGGAYERPIAPPHPKIIHVTPETGKAACAMESGVCVIRP